MNECYERKSTVVPQQALAMFNSQLVAVQAEKITARYADLSDLELVGALFDHVLCRPPTAEETAQCTQYLAEFGGSPEARLQLTLVLLNHNDFVTIR